MNATGTERQRAVIAAFKVKPEATRREIANAAGVTLTYAGQVMRDYLASKARDHVCQVPVRTTSRPAQRVDVASFALDRRRIGGNPGPGPATGTAKQQATRSALAANPPCEGERKMDYCRRIAGIAGVSPGYVQHTTTIIVCEEIGAAVRAKEAAEAKTELVRFNGNVGPVQHFTSWLDVFHKFQMTAVAYLLHAQSRGDVYATAFLKDIRDISDRAATRAAMSKTG
jgi:hypothetical protein